MARQPSVLKEGVVAGLLGAAVVAVWFLLFDLARGTPFLTPSLLGGIAFHGLYAPLAGGVSAGAVLGYTVLHGLAFVAFGVIAASLIAASEREPPLVIGVVILFACFETLFLGLVGALGKSVSDLLEWWAILVGNLLATAVMLWYFLLRHRRLPRVLVGSWWGVLREGVVAGLVGAVVVALWFLAVDTIQGQPLRTPRLLGGAFLRFFWDGGPVVLKYTLLHGVAFVFFGIVASVLIAGAEREPMFVFALVILFTSFEVLFFGAIVIGAKWLLDEVSGWTIFVGNLLASAAMLAYFFRRHRTLARRMTEAWAEDE